jgi:chloramphenicol 3-O-phosphotransferase
MDSKIILLNGASSAGKSTLAQALQDQIEFPFLQFSLDFMMFNSKVLPKRRDSSGAFAWSLIPLKIVYSRSSRIFSIFSRASRLVSMSILA